MFKDQDQEQTSLWTKTRKSKNQNHTPISDWLKKSLLMQQSDVQPWKWWSTDKNITGHHSVIPQSTYNKDW